MLHATKCAAILLLLAATACATPATRPIADSACTAFRTISYAIPPLGTDGTRAVESDPGNALDTPETVAEVQSHNAAFRAICPPTEED